MLVEGKPHTVADDQVRAVAFVDNPPLHGGVGGGLEGLRIAPIGLLQISHEAPQVPQEGKPTHPVGVQVLGMCRSLQGAGAEVYCLRVGILRFGLLCGA